jgi:hypothetical protein
VAAKRRGAVLIGCNAIAGDSFISAEHSEIGQTITPNGPYQDSPRLTGYPANGSTPTGFLERMNETRSGDGNG